MIKRRNLALVAIFAIITLGIYSIYWLYATRKEIVAVNGRPKSIPRVIVLFTPVILLVALTLIALPLSFMTSDSATTAAPLILVASILLVLAAIAVSIWWFYRYCQASAAVIGESKSFLFAIWLLCSLFGILLIWMIVVQYHLNKLAPQTAPHENPESNPAPTGPPQSGSQDEPTRV